MTNKTANLRAEVLRLMSVTNGAEHPDAERLLDALIDSAREERPARAVQLAG